MSEQQLEQPAGKEALEISHGYKEMTVSNPVHPEVPEDNFSPDQPDIRRAADELTGRREADQIAREGRPHDGERNYTRQGGPKAGEAMPPNETVSAEQAAFDVANARALESDIAAAELQSEIAAAIDRIRAGDEQAPAEPVAQQQQPVQDVHEWQRLSEAERQARWECPNISGQPSCDRPR
jgi:hypothetical protein